MFVVVMMQGVSKRRPGKSRIIAGDERMQSDATMDGWAEPQPHAEQEDED